MQNLSERPVKTFTIGVDDASLDEAPFAAAVAKHLGSDHSEMRVTDADARAVIPKLPELYDEPFADFLSDSHLPGLSGCAHPRYGGAFGRCRRRAFWGLPPLFALVTHLVATGSDSRSPCVEPLATQS